VHRQHCFPFLAHKPGFCTLGDYVM
jgi:hypothetical protein